MAKKKNITLRVPPDTYERFEDYRAEKGDISKADAGRRLLELALDEVESEEPESSTGGGGGAIRDLIRSIAGVAIVATLVLATAGMGITWPLPATAVGMTIAVVMRADQNADKRLESMRTGAKEQVGEVLRGGQNNDSKISLLSRAWRLVKQLFVILWSGLTGAWEKAKEEHSAPRNPSTVFERLAWADLYGLAGLIVACVISFPLAILLHFFTAGEVISLLGLYGTMVYIGLIVTLMYVWLGSVVVAFLAHLAVATAGRANEEAVAEEVDT